MTSTITMLELVNDPPPPELAELAALLSRLVDTVAAGRMLSAGELDAFNAVVGASPVHVRLEDGGDGRYVLDMTPVADDPLELRKRELAGELGGILRRDPTRLKRCENPDCRRAFLDETRNRSRRWCDSAGCGNRMRVRRHRARQAA